MAAIEVEIIAIGVTLMTPIYYGLYLLNCQDNVSAVSRAKITSDLESNTKQTNIIYNDVHKATDNLNALTIEIQKLAVCVDNITSKVHSCHFCNTETKVVEFEDDEWRFRSK